ncbi:MULTISPECIES: RagB/SusD family nutrient uptake outer membrane protein [Parabacteroides]|uniref:RagB/SusD family nutrient uptake outer membrane protein n=2 Tax=Parabacteroides leei TaxID=2939491 RepID=UPI00189A05AF|nr:MULTISPECIES: RagB/SusD family nutrient uptake outer membrane protein [Parabacteroides]MCL3850685.1 RagB/SusD family nutrient uptake outer membrane protein [Parabacteroides leei]
MKKLNILALCTAVCLSSCDPLGIEPTTSVFEDQFWANAQLSRTFVNQFYLWGPAGANQAFQAEQWSDNACGNIDRDQNTFRQYDYNGRRYDEMNSAGIVGAPWGDGYKRIRQTNLAIERIPEVPNITEEESSQLLAESYAFRALYYADMERYWGIMPIITNTMTIFDETMLPQNSREEVFDQILSDYDKALELFKKASVKPTLGLLNENAVQVLKSRSALAAACAAEASAKGLYDQLAGSVESKTLYKFTKDAGHYYQMAYEAAKSVIGKYELESDYAKLFNTSNGHTSVESIWPVMFNESNRSGFNPGYYSHPVSWAKMYGGTTDFNPDWDGGRGGAYPTQDLVDCYYQKDKATGKWMQWWKTTQSKELGLTQNDQGQFTATSENYLDMYTDRDKRFYATILHDSTYYAGAEHERYLIRTWIDFSEPTKSEKYSSLGTYFKHTEKLDITGGAQSTVTSYYAAKYTIGRFNENGTVNGTQSPSCYFMVRYAEALLNYAEAAYKLGGKENETLDAINQIRNRAGLDNFEASVVGHDLWEEYKLQRRIEFAFEVPGHRYFDLLRWGESEGKTVIDELNKNSRGMFIFRKGIESEEVGLNGYLAPKSDPKYFTPYFYVRTIDQSVYYDRKFDDAVFYKLPFSRSTLEVNRNFVQNPGWENRSYQ